MDAGRPSSRSGSPFDHTHLSPGRSARTLAGAMASSAAGGMSIRAQLDNMSMTMHEVVGRTELSGRQIVALEEGAVEDGVRHGALRGTSAARDATRGGCSAALLHERRGSGGGTGVMEAASANPPIFPTFQPPLSLPIQTATASRPSFLRRTRC